MNTIFFAALLLGGLSQPSSPFEAETHSANIGSSTAPSSVVPPPPLPGPDRPDQTIQQQIFPTGDGSARQFHTRNYYRRLRADCLQGGFDYRQMMDYPWHMPPYMGGAPAATLRPTPAVGPNRGQ